MYSLLITITNPKVEGPITLDIFGRSVDFEYVSRGRVRKLVGMLKSTSSISKDGVTKIKDLLKEHGASVEVTYKEDPVIAKAAKNIEKMLSGLGEKMNKKSMRAKSSAREKTMTRKKAAKVAQSLAAMPEAEMSMVIAQLPKSIQKAVAAQSSRRGRTFSSMRHGSMSKTMRRAREKKYAHMMKKRLAYLASIAEENERGHSV